MVSILVQCVFDLFSSPRSSPSHLHCTNPSILSDRNRHLKLKWASVNAAYQKLTFTLDTPAKTKRKEEYERQLTEIEKDIRMMEKGEHLLVVAD